MMSKCCRSFVDSVYEYLNEQPVLTEREDALMEEALALIENDNLSQEQEAEMENRT